MKIGNTIYLDHQATTPVEWRVLAEMTPYFTESFGNPHSDNHALGWETSRAVDEAAARVARLIGAHSDEIIFTSGATESNNLALLGLARRAAGGKRHRVLVGAAEHKCVLAAGRALEDHHGFKVECLPVSSEGFVEASTLEDSLDDDVLLVSVMAVNNEIGTIEEIESLSKIVKSYGALFHCDAAQAPLAIDLSSFAEYVDTISLSAHKMYGPKGIGADYVARELQERIEPLVYGGVQQNGLRSGTVPVPLCVGMGMAADILADEAADEQRKELGRKRDRFVAGLNRLAWPITMNGPKGKVRHPGNANIRFTGFAAHDILATLQPHLAASSGSACTSGMPEPSHVLKAIGLTSDEAESSIRFSPGFFTSDDDIDEAVERVGEVLQKLSEADPMWPPRVGCA
ncbi:MAG: cysteine desulfurase family protein [Rhodobacteraceae bacterium]|nr:cysteine desulfurase family protein [Paracoccaceae bacterium]